MTILVGFMNNGRKSVDLMKCWFRRESILGQTKDDLISVFIFYDCYLYTILEKLYNYLTTSTIE